jgi:hypothetical protein
MGYMARSFDPDSPCRRRIFRTVVTDVSGSGNVLNSATPVKCFMGFPEKDATATGHVFVVEKVILQVSGVSGNGSDSVSANVKKGVAGTSICSTAPELAGTAAAGAKSEGVVSVVEGVAEVAAGTALYGYLTFTNGRTTGFQAVSLTVQGYYKNEF